MRDRKILLSTGPENERCTVEKSACPDADREFPTGPGNK